MFEKIEDFVSWWYLEIFTVCAVICTVSVVVVVIALLTSNL